MIILFDILRSDKWWSIWFFSVDCSMVLPPARTKEIPSGDQDSYQSWYDESTFSEMRINMVTTVCICGSEWGCLSIDDKSQLRQCAKSSPKFMMWVYELNVTYVVSSKCIMFGSPEISLPIGQHPEWRCGHAEGPSCRSGGVDWELGGAAMETLLCMAKVMTTASQSFF